MSGLRWPREARSSGGEFAVAGPEAALMKAECRRRSRSPGRLPLIPCVYLVGFLDLFGVSLVVPLLSRHIKLLGGSSTVAGLIGSLYGLLQLFSSLVIGSWSDVVGRQSILLVTLILSGFSYGLLGFSSNICLVTLARIPTGIFKHTQTILKALLSDLVPGYKRPHVIGRFCAASSVGFILGPILSGYLVELDGGFYITCFICCFIFLLNAGVVCWLPYKERLYIPTKELHLRTETSCESTCTSLGKEDNRKLLDTASNGVAKHKASDPFWSQCISVGLKIKGLVCSNLWDVFLVRFLMALANLLYFSNFVLAIEERFSVPPSLIGYLISYGGIMGALSGFIAGSVARLYNNNTSLLLLHSSILTCCTMAVYSFATSIQVVVLCTTLLGFSTATGRMCVTVVELSRTERQARGTLMGAGQSVTAVARILAPLLSGLVQEVSVRGPPMLGAVLALLAILHMISIRSKFCKTTEAKTKLE